MKRKDFIEAMRRDLIERRLQLLDEISRDESLLYSVSNSTEPRDTADEASDRQAGEISAQLADVEFKEIANIDEALSRISNKTYGICEGCNKNIAIARLQAIPHARLCIECKRIAEEHGSDEDSINWSVIFGQEDSITDADASVS